MVVDTMRKWYPCGQYSGGVVEKAKDLDKRFDNGENILNALDVSRATRPGHVTRRLQIQLPVWMIESLDREASRLGVTRQSIIKMWIAQMLERASA